jgi:meiotic recombination protein SPO11
MGITTAGRGLAAGRLEVHEFGTSTDGVWRDFSGIHAPPYEIPGDIDAVEATHASGGVRVAASYALVVEKDAVFDRLRRERIWERVPLVLVTAKGFPDLATRAFLKGIQNRFPSVTMLGLVDWNPSGALILRAYRSGSARAALESARYALEVKWLGVRFADITDHVRDGAATMPLTRLDRAKIRNLLETADARTEAGRATRSELSEMARLDRKAEIESLCPLERGGGSHGASLSEYVVGKIVRGEYV